MNCGRWRPAAEHLGTRRAGNAMRRSRGGREGVSPVRGPLRVAPRAAEKASYGPVTAVPSAGSAYLKDPHRGLGRAVPGIRLRNSTQRSCSRGPKCAQAAGHAISGLDGAPAGLAPGGLSRRRGWPRRFGHQRGGSSRAPANGADPPPSCTSSPRLYGAYGRVAPAQRADMSESRKHPTGVSSFSTRRGTDT